MKKTIIILTLTLICFSCDNWIERSPSDENLREKEMFGTETAFRNYLNGIYTFMCSPEIFGGTLTMGGMEFLGQTLVPDDDLRAWTDFDFSGTNESKAIKELYEGLYATIYRCNDLLRLLDKYSGVEFAEGSREMIRAETVALRAMLHHQLARTFNPAVSVSPDSKGIVWVDGTDSEPDEFTTLELYEKILSELSLAIAALKTCDPVATHISPDTDILYGSRPEDRVWKMNYYAAIAIKARILMEQGMPEKLSEAYALAREVITATDADGGLLYGFVSTPGSDLAFSREHIFGIASPVTGLRELSDRLFADRGIGIAGWVGLEELKAGHANDKRLSWVSGDLKSLAPKFGSGSYTESWNTPQRIPVVKLGEMHLIAAEAAARITGISAGMDELEEFLAGRFSGTDLTDTPSAEEFKAEILRQYAYEFLGEGQLFFIYKRLNESRITSYTREDINMDPEKYRLPIPR